MTKYDRITTLFLDVGGVLLTNGWDREARRRTVERFQLDYDEIDERHHLTFDTYEEGKLSLDEYLDRVVFYRQRAFSREDFKEFMFMQSRPLPEMIELIRTLKARYQLKTVVVSNEGRELTEFRIKQFALHEFIDAFIASCFVHCRKPDEDIFRLALDVAQVCPHEVAYIDDRLMFVEVARSLGIHGIHHVGLEPTSAALAEMRLSLPKESKPERSEVIESGGSSMDFSTYDIGMVGLGVMGRNLVLNMADHGFAVTGYNRHPDKVSELEKETEGRKVRGARSIVELVGPLRKPRAVMLMVPAGQAVDEMIGELLPHLEPGDLIIDGGNSHYKNTDTRAKALDDKDIQFLGVGISGGEQGARLGPSMMPGGHKDAYERVRPIFEAIAAKAHGEACVTYLGPRSAGHYVKMVHNGIEYGLMQLIAETYDLMKRGLGLNNDELADVYCEWNQWELQSFLVEITSEIFKHTDETTGRRLIDEILDKAHQKGTGKWTSQDAMDLQVPVPTMDTAVSMRDMSTYKSQREAAAKQLLGPAAKCKVDRNAFVQEIRNALYAAVITTYAQGMSLLKAASEAYRYELQLHDVARIWRRGCIIRARLLDDIQAAFEARPDLPNLILDARLSKAILERQGDLRKVVQVSAETGIPSPALMASLSYFDAFRSSWLPANLIQAQRDYFGSHTYERIGEKGSFHTIW